MGRNGMPILDITTYDGKQLRRTIEKETFTIGRSNDNSLVLSDKSVSRHHAEIKKTKEGYRLTDLGSYNGTKVNEKLTQSVLLKDNDKIKIGLTSLTFFVEKKDAAPKEIPLVLTTDKEYENEHKEVLKSFSQSSAIDLKELLVSPGVTKTPKEAAVSAPPEETQVELERTNKVLFVLYEISRQLNTIHDFKELLKRIMDLIFMVINADYGFLVLTGDKKENQLIPMVVKYRDDQEKDSSKLKTSKTLIQKVIHNKVAILTSNAMTDSRFNGAKSLFIQKIKSAICVPLWRKDEIIGVIQLDSMRFDNQFTQDDLELLKAIGSQMAMIIEQANLNEQIRQEEIMRSRLERFHSPQVIEMILRGSQETKDNIMEPKDLTATVLFTDIIDFTQLAEQSSPRETNIILNQYFSAMTEIIFRFDGTLDKYIGDGLMAVFGAPMERENDAKRAILAAKEMKRQLAVMMAAQEGSRMKFNIRIGINTGRVVAGNIGSPRRLDYTVIGDPVNIASRLESIAKPNQILIGEETYKAVKGKFKIKKIGSKKVKGKTAEVMVYEVM
jgi:adenylate cyclase